MKPEEDPEREEALRKELQENLDIVGKATSVDKFRVEKYIQEPVSETIAESRWFNNILQDIVAIDAEVGTENDSLESREALRKYLIKEISGHHLNIAMVCRGKDCPIWVTCHHFKNDTSPPLGVRCPVERAMLVAVMGQYATELGLEDGSYVDLQYVKDLALLDVLERRMFGILSQGEKQTLVEEFFTGEYDDEGNAIKIKHVTFEFDILERIRTRREKIFKAFMATRFDKHKKAVAEKVTVQGDPSLESSRFKREFDRILEVSRTHTRGD